MQGPIQTSKTTQMRNVQGKENVDIYSDTGPLCLLLEDGVIKSYRIPF